MPFVERSILTNGPFVGCGLYSESRVQRIAASLRALFGSCEKCLDEGFAVDAMIAMEKDPRRAFDCFQDCLALVRVGSAAVERAHLYGHDLKLGKSRGLSCDSATLACNTYIRSVVREAETICRSIGENAARARGSTRASWQRMSMSLRLSRTHEII